MCKVNCSYCGRLVKAETCMVRGGNHICLCHKKYVTAVLKEDHKYLKLVLLAYFSLPSDPCADSVALSVDNFLRKEVMRTCEIGKVLWEVYHLPPLQGDVEALPSSLMQFKNDFVNEVVHFMGIHNHEIQHDETSNSMSKQRNILRLAFHQAFDCLNLDRDELLKRGKQIDGILAIQTAVRPSPLFVL